MNKKKDDYSNFYIGMIIILSVILIVITVLEAIEEIEYIKHLQSDLNFMKETGEFIVYEAEIIGYCAKISNMSNEELLKDFTNHKANEIINGMFALGEEND